MFVLRRKGLSRTARVKTTNRRPYQVTQLINANMTLPELVEAAADSKSGILRLSEKERDYLLLLLYSYAEDVLEHGQLVRLGPVILTKSPQGKVAVTVLE